MPGGFTPPEQMKWDGGPARPWPGGVMREASKLLEFEYAAIIRDKIIKLRGEG